MSGDISGRVFKNVSGSSLQITDVGVFEIPPDGLVSTSDYPIMETSTQFRRLVSLSYLLEDPSQGRRIGSRDPVRTQSVDIRISDDDLNRIVDEVTRRVGDMISTIQPIGIPQTQDPTGGELMGDGRTDGDRAEIISHVIRTSLPTVEQFGDIEEISGDDDVPDVESMVERIQRMGRPKDPR